jgi:hypothetical protein
MQALDALQGGRLDRQRRASARIDAMTLPTVALAMQPERTRHVLTPELLARLGALRPNPRSAGR